jgi:hypothetical protein
MCNCAYKCGFTKKFSLLTFYKFIPNSLRLNLNNAISDRQPDLEIQFIDGLVNFLLWLQGIPYLVGFSIVCAEPLLVQRLLPAFVNQSR